MGPERDRHRAPAAGEWDASRYDEAASFVWVMGADLVRLLDPRPGEHILDLGCGTGHLTAEIAESGAEVLGIDASLSMVQQALGNYPHLRFEVLDAARMDFSPQFEAVFSNAALHWVTEPANVVTGVWNSLKAGARFVAEFGGKGNIAAIVTALNRAREVVGAPAVKREPWYFPSIEAYASLLESQGFRVSDAHLFRRPTPLAGEERGMREWLEIFPKPLTEDLSGAQRGEVVGLVEDELRPTMFKGGQWVADYVRIRVRAFKG